MNLSKHMKINIDTQNLRIKNFTIKNINKRYISWLNNKKLMNYSIQKFQKHTYKSSMRYYLGMKKSKNLFLAIYKKNFILKHIGNISVYFDMNNKLADMSIIIGEKSAKGKGYGFEAWNSVLSKLLKSNKIRKVTAGTMELNRSMIRIIKKSKMKKIGYKKSAVLYKKKYQNIIYFSKPN